MPLPIAAEVRVKRVAAAMRQTPFAVLVSTINSGLMAVIAGVWEGHVAPLVWMAAIVAIGLARLGLWQAHARDRAAAEHARQWGRAVTGGAAAAGLAWGGGAVWLWPDTESEQLFWVFVLGGMCAGAAALHYAHLPSALAFVLTAGPPVGLRFALEGSGRGLVAAAMIAVFLAALVAIGRRSSALFGDYLRLRLEAARRARALDAANTRLRQEMEDHRATEAHLRQAQKVEALGQLTGGVAHDFNNLLMAVLGSLALLRKRLPAEDRQAARLLDNALAGANRGAALTQRLLAFARRQALRPEAVALPGLVRDMAGLLRRSVGPVHGLQTNVPDRLPPAFVDHNQLELALLNLVVNARDAMPKGGLIRIQGRAEVIAGPGEGGLPAGRYVVLAVADHGIGMDAATLARATEPFFTTKGTGKGTGLGLPMVHGLAAQSGGRLLLRSSPGAGTLAELWLPAAVGTRPGMAGAGTTRPVSVPLASPAAPGGRLTVLVVDDDPLVLASTAAMVEDLGHAVIEAGSGPQALDRLCAGAAPDLLVTDYGMPGMTGLDLARTLRDVRPALPVLVATGYGEMPEIAEAGLFRLSKPFTQAELAAAIATLAPGAAPLRA